MSETAGIGVVDRRVVVPRTFAWSGEPQGERLRWFAAGLRAVMLDQGYTEIDEPGPGDDVTRQTTRAGRQRAALDLLPAAFPIEEILSDRDLRHVKLLYGIGGLSYGNVSARRVTGADEPQPQYWMSASGVDKSQ